MKILCVGAGLANASAIHFLQRAFAKRGLSVNFDVIDSRAHVGGNCHTQIDEDTNITIHKYGPHIFNTNSKIAWDFVNQYLSIHPYTNRVKAITPKGIFSMPINLHTINQYYQASMNVAQATTFMQNITAKFKKADYSNFEEVMLSHLGKDLYNEFIYGYTKKQWGVEPNTLPASIARRLPFRLNYNDNYYNKKYQGLPIEGYTPLFEKIFSASNVNLSLNVSFEKTMEKDYDLILYSGTIDQFFDFEFGQLSYRTVYWEKHTCDGYFQGNAVINYTTEDKPYTRINEPIFFEPWKKQLPNGQSIYFMEYSKETGTSDTPYYPIRREEDLHRLSLYQKRLSAQEFSKFIFHGRLGMYKYLDMDMTIDESAALTGHLEQRFLK